MYALLVLDQTFVGGKFHKGSDDVWTSWRSVGDFALPEKACLFK